jgi:hypothetical protein
VKGTPWREGTGSQEEERLGESYWLPHVSRSAGAAVPTGSLLSRLHP